MSASFDLNILPLLRQGGQDQPEWPGLYAATPPRGAARGRDADLLVLYLTVTGTAPLPADQLVQLMPRLARMYYRTAGTVTAALKAVVEELNQFLLERNVRSSNTGRQGTGLLTQVVLRGELLFIAHSGPAQTYLLHAQSTEMLADESGAGRGLGLSRTASLRYFQNTLKGGEFLLLCHHAEAGWNLETVRSSPGQGIESMRRRLLSAARADFHAVLAQALGGTGKLRLMRLKSPFPDMAHPTGAESQVVRQPLAEETQAAPEGSWPEPPAAASFTSELQATQEPSPPAAPEEQNRSADALPMPLQPVPDLAVEPELVEREEPFEENLLSAAEAASQAPDPTLPQDVFPPSSPRLKAPSPAAARPQSASPARPAPPPRRPAPALRSRIAAGLRPVTRVFLAIFQAIGRTLGQFLRALGAVLKRLLPDETLLNISPGAMVFLAVLVPLVISIIGGSMYVQRGQALQHDQYYQKALAAVERAETAQEPEEQRGAWKLTLEMLSEAEVYRTSVQTLALRQKAQSALDLLDGVERLQFRPAILGGLGESLRITRMAALPGELYLLDSHSGMVLRAILTGSSFEVDRQFVCGPVQGSPSVGPLIDLAPLPRGHESGATVAAIDANGGLLFCIPGEQPEVMPLAPPPINFSTPKAFAIDSGDTYLLDPGNNAVWIYRNMDFTQPPRLFFGDQVPFMQDVVDLAVYNDDLYLLHSDGRQTLCTYSSLAESPSRCEDPLVYSDSRPGRSSGAVIPDSLFDQMVFAPPPDPSLYLLDPVNQAVFHFSLRLNFQRQYRSATAFPPGSATAFGVSSDRLLFLAVDNAVFFALLP